MPSFTDVVTGNQTLASNVNQLVDALNGTVASQVDIVSPANNAFAILGELASAPTADQWVVGGQVNNDTNPRVGFYVRSTGGGGYGGLLAGPGGAGAFTAHLYASASGWNIPESLTVTGSVTGGAAHFSSLVNTGTSSLDNGAITTNGSGTLSATLLKSGGSNVWTAGNDGSGSGLDADTLDGVQGTGYSKVGSHNGVTYTLSAGNGAPASLAANEIYIQLS